jgi:type IV pilus assembly protein PilA
VPSFLRSRIAANESSAAASIRTINSAMISYNSAYPTVGYAAGLVNLGPGGVTSACPIPPTSTTACLIDGQLASGSKSGYIITVTNVTGTPNSTYNVIASPSANYLGARYFCSFSDAVVRVSLSAITTCDGTVPVQQ